MDGPDMPADALLDPDRDVDLEPGLDDGREAALDAGRDIFFHFSCSLHQFLDLLHWCRIASHYLQRTLFLVRASPPLPYRASHSLLASSQGSILPLFH